MIRLALTSIHTLLALILGVASAWLVAQATLNRAWEQAFYGVISDATGQILVRSWIFLVLAGALLVVCFGYARRWRWGGPLLAGWATLLLFTPLQVLGMLTLAVVLLEGWSRRPAPPPEQAAGA